MADKQTKETSQTPPAGFERVEDFYTDYANNVFLESSLWDLKLVFGQLDQNTNPPTTEQRAAITIPWRQAKILNYLLSVHIRAHELDAGSRITIPKAIIPPEPTPGGDEPGYVGELYDYMRKLRQETFGEDLKPQAA
jgi:hypothetical protein